jgi:hypothetical protein
LVETHPTVYAIAKIARAIPIQRRTQLISADGVMCFTGGLSIAGLIHSLRMGFLLGSVIVGNLLNLQYLCQCLMAAGKLHRVNVA